MTAHWFWFALVLAVVLWYSSITIWVAIKGALDIREMVARLDEEQAEARGMPTTNEHE